MIYEARINKRLRYIKVYAIRQKIGQHETVVTKLFTRIFAPKKREEEESMPRG